MDLYQILQYYTPGYLKLGYCHPLVFEPKNGCHSVKTAKSLLSGQL